MIILLTCDHYCSWDRTPFAALRSAPAMDLLDQDLDAISLELGEDEPTARLGRLKVRPPRPSAAAICPTRGDTARLP